MIYIGVIYDHILSNVKTLEARNASWSSFANVLHILKLRKNHLLVKVMRMLTLVSRD